MTDSSESLMDGDAAAALSPDEAAQLLRQLISNHHARAYRYALHLSGSPADAEDIVQQAFLIVQQRLHQLRDINKAESWLLSIVRTTFLKSIRRQRPVDAGSLELNIGDIPADVADSPIDQEQLQYALSCLSDDYRLVLLMFYFEDASYREIAERLELPIGTVMSRLSRAKGKLRAALLAQDGFEPPMTSDRAKQTEATDG